MVDIDPNQCELCLRFVKKGTTEHHLIPRTCHKNRWFKKNFSRQQMAKTALLCRECHSEVHHQIPSEKELGRHWNTIERLKEHEGMRRFLTFIQKQK